MFISNPLMDQVTTTFHSNALEKSHAMQLLGAKIWLLMKPDDYFGTFKAYSIGAYNAAFNVCPQDLAKVEMQAVIVRPGEALSFPKSWTHHIYTRKGPNMMVNFRNLVVKPWLVRDAIALVSHLASILRTKPSDFACTKFCDPETTFPTSYGRGHPIPSVTHNSKMEMDLRCTDLINPYITQYKRHLMDSIESSDEFDANIYNQVTHFLEID